MQRYATLLEIPTPDGLLWGVSLAGEGDDASVRGELAPGEWAYAEALSARRRPTFVGGRLALRRAAARLGLELPAVLPDDRGAPALPRGVVGSISHKDSLAVALLAPADGATRGVDVERVVAPRVDLSRQVLAPDEAAELSALEGEARWRAVLLRFSVKEAIYKAIDPFVRRYVGFQEVTASPSPPSTLAGGDQGGGEVAVCARLPEGAFVISASWRTTGMWLITFARAERG